VKVESRMTIVKSTLRRFLPILIVLALAFPLQAHETVIFLGAIDGDTSKIHFLRWR